MKISKDKKLCEEYMGKHPVISISLKGINAASYEAAFELTVKTIKGAVEKAGFLKMNDKLDEDEKKEYRAILDENMSEATLFGSLKNLSELLEKHYETKVILLIDEYDVPLAKAFENGYYDKMVFLIRNLLEQTLKTNNSLKFAVMTGCMRISKESIFTGLNNLKVLSITDEHFDEYFGFTDEDVKEMLRLFLKIIGFIPVVMRQSRKSFKCQEILQQSARLNVCWREKKLSKRFVRNLLIRKCISLWKISGVFCL